jgi:uncharacterized membrane protein YidH (DUF202 family)
VLHCHAGPRRDAGCCIRRAAATTGLAGRVSRSFLSADLPEITGWLPPREAEWTSRLFFALLVWGVLSAWTPARWPSGILQAGLLGLAFAWGLRKAWTAERLRLNWPCWVAAGVAAWGLAQKALGWTVYWRGTLEGLLYWLTAFAACWLAAELGCWRQLRSWMRTALGWFAFTLAVASVVFYFGTPGKIFGLFPVSYRAVGPFLNRDHYASFIALLLPVVLWEGLIRRRPLWSRALMAGAMYASVIAGASRAGSLVVTVEILLLLFLAWDRGHEEVGLIRRAAGWTAFFAVTFVLVVGWDVLWQRFKEPDPWRGRREMLQAAWAMVRDRPWSGFGLGNWAVVYPAYAVWDPGLGLYVNHAHNEWAEWAVEGGLPMLAAMLSLGLWAIRRGLRRPWGIGAAAVLVHSVVDFPLRRLAVAVLLFTLLGMLGRTPHRERAPRLRGSNADPGAR